jgi:AraC family transcriptional regulator
MNSQNDQRPETLAFPLRAYVKRHASPQLDSPVAMYPMLPPLAHSRYHWHRAFELAVMFDGSRGELFSERIDGSANRAAIGGLQCALIPPGASHALSIDNPQKHISLFIDDRVIEQTVLEKLKCIAVEDLRRLGWCDPLLCELVNVINGRPRVHTASFFDHSLFTTLAVKLIEGFARLHENHDLNRIRLSERDRVRVHEYLTAHLETKFRVVMFAKHMAMSVPNLTRRFRVTYGMAPLQYVLKLRVDKALALLRVGDIRIADAAFAVGFCDQSHLDRHCRKFYGAAPSTLMRGPR